MLSSSCPTYFHFLQTARTYSRDSTFLFQAMLRASENDYQLYPPTDSLQSVCINKYVPTFQTARNKHDRGKCQVILSFSRKTSRENESCDTGVAPTKSLRQKPSTNADSSSASHEIPRPFFGSRRFATGLQGRKNPVQIIPPYVHLNIIFPSTPSSSKWSLSLRYSYQNSAFIFLLFHTTRPSHFILFDLTTPIIFGEEYKL